MQMRDEIATGFLSGMSGDSLGNTSAVALQLSAPIVEPQDDMNMSRWPMTEYWENFLANRAAYPLLVCAWCQLFYLELIQLCDQPGRERPGLLFENLRC